MTNVESFHKRFLKAKELRELRWIDIAKKSGLDKAQISQYKNGVHEPEQEALYKLAAALNVNVAWLMGADTPMDDKLFDLSEDAKFILSSYQMLNDTGKLEFTRLLNTVLSVDTYRI